MSTESPHSIVEGWPVCRACQGSRVLVCYTHGVSKEPHSASWGRGSWAVDLALGDGQLLCLQHAQARGRSL